MGSLGSAISELDSARLVALLSTIAIVAIVVLMRMRSSRGHKAQPIGKPAADPFQHQATLDSLPAAVILLDASGEVCHFNDAWLKLAREHPFNLSDGGKGQHYRQVLRTLTHTPESDPETTLEAGIRRVASSPDQRFDEEVLTVRKGNWPWFQIYVRTMEDDDHSNVLLMIVNISGRKRKQIDLDSTLEDLMDAASKARKPGGDAAAGSLQRRAANALPGVFRDLLSYNLCVKLALGALRTISQSIHDRPAYCIRHPNNKVAL